MVSVVKKTVGILALQGDFAKHEAVIKSLGVETKLVRTPEDLQACDALIIPGGESTTIYRQLEFIKLTQPLTEFAQKKPVFGTCAGLILMSQTIVSENFIKPLKILDVTVERNAYGRQCESFSTDLEVSLPEGNGFTTSAFFIRAPKIKNCGEEVSVLATYNDEPVFVRQGHHFGASFHPELTEDSRIHQYFLSFIHEK